MINNNDAIIIVILFLAIIAASFLATAGVLWLICWAFHWTWCGWRVCFGIWLLLAVLSSVFKANISR